MKLADASPCLAPSLTLNRVLLSAARFIFVAASLSAAPTISGELKTEADPSAGTRESKRQEHLSVKDFGAVGDGLADDTLAIQACIDAAMAPGSGHRVFLPAGKYKTSDTIHLGYGSGGFDSVVLEGEGYMYAPTLGTMNGTAILPTFSDRPCINVQGARGTVIRGISLGGKLRNYIDANNLASNSVAPARDDTLAASWNDPQLAPTADSRYVPYAGIAIDAYSGGAPETHYPAVRYPGPLGLTSQYGKSYSSDVLIENCYIEGFAVAVANQPCDADGNGDFTTLRRVYIRACKWGLSVGNSQSRNVHLDGVKFAFVYCCLTNNSHGRQNGKFNGAVIDMSVYNAINLVNLNLAAAGPMTFTNLYAESLWRIGTLSAGTQVEPSVVFNTSRFGFHLQNEARGVPATVLDSGPGTPADIRFNGCSFENYPSVVTISAPFAQFDGCMLRPESVRAQEYERFAHNATAGGLITHQLANPRFGRIKTNFYDHDTGKLSGAAFTGPVQLDARRNKCATLYSDRIAAFADPTAPAIATPGMVTSIAKSKLASATLTNRTLTFSFPSRSDAIFQNYGPLPGDVIWDDVTGSVFFVRSRTGSSVTAELQNNYRSVQPGTSVPVVPIPLDKGNYYIGNSRIYTPAYYLRGDTSASSAVLSNVARDDGFSAWFNDEIAVGDSVLARQTSDKWVGDSNSVIVARDQAAGTITLKGNCDRELVRKRLDLFVRTPPPNQ